MENGHAEVSEGKDDTPEVDPYEKKYFTLLKRCENIQQSNERLVNRLHHVKKLLRRLRHERRFLMRRLGTHEDNYRDIPLILPIDTGMEEDESFGMAAPADFPISPPPQTEVASPRPGSASILSGTLLSPPTGSTSSLPSPSAMWSSPKAGPSSASSCSGALLGNCSGSLGLASATASVNATNSTANSKKRSRSDKDKDRGKSKKLTNPFLNYPLDQRKVADSYVNQSTKEDLTHQESPSSSTIGQTKSWNNAQDEKKMPYEMYNGDKDVWLYGSIAEDLPHTLALDKKIVLMPSSAGTSLS